MSENWKPVVGYEGLYEVSDLGRIARLLLSGQRRVLRPISDGSGRQQVSLCRKAIRRARRIHHLVLEAFVGECPVGMVCCHGDGNASNNQLENLRWDTQKANCADAARHGTQHRGERTGGSKLLDVQVHAVRALAAAGWNNTDISRVFGTTTNCIWKIVNEETWAHV